MLTLKEIIEKIKSYKGLKNEGDVAKLLKLKQSTLSTQKKRGIPASTFYEIIDFCEKEGISLDSFMLNPATSVREETAPYDIIAPDEIMKLLNEIPEARPHILKILQGYKDIKDGTEGLKKSARRTGK